LAFPEDSCPGNANNASVFGLLTSFSNENPDLRLSILDLDQDERNDEVEVGEIISKLWSKDAEIFVRFSDRKESNSRLCHHSHLEPKLQMPRAHQRFAVFPPTSKSIADIQIQPIETSRELGGDEVEVEIRATALNYRDLFLILRPADFILPAGDEGFGADISGVIKSAGSRTSFKVGDEVMSFQLFGGFQSHVTLPALLVVPKPAGFTFVDAATVPCSFITAYEGLVKIAGINSTDRVLIHVATGGVGLASIQVCMEAGATIYATAGSKRKRAYLGSLGIAHVYNSRNTNYGQEIFKDTGGAGVTIVLNSLTASGYKETSLSICAQGATFVELGKIGIFTAAEVSQIRSDVNYAVFDVSTFPFPYIAQVLGLLLPKFGNETYKPLPSTTYALTEFKGAVDYFSRAKHIGKVVIKMPEICPDVGGGVWSQKIFNEQSTYLITGGLGGIGMEVANWMLSSGAKTIVLVGRRPPTAHVQERIDAWNASGGNILVFSIDVGDYKAVEQLLELIQKDALLSPLRGIFHAAGTLKDAFVSNQTLETLADVFKPKVIGAWNLHLLTQESHLDFFVTFSSICAVTGLQGQSNYAAANRYLDSFVNYRRSVGLPGLTINWGPRADVRKRHKMSSRNFGKLTCFQLLPQVDHALIFEFFLGWICCQIENWTRRSLWTDAAQTGGRNCRTGIHYDESPKSDLRSGYFGFKSIENYRPAWRSFL